MPIRLDHLVTLSQTRNSRNRAAPELKDSIKKELHNPILVAKMSHQGFVDYVSFVNKIWRVENDIDDAPVDDLGNVHLVIAGHTRVEAIRDLAQERSQEQLPPVEGGALVSCKIYENMSPEDIIAVQLDENIYHAPPKERTAMAIVETYLWGLEVNKWKNRAEFLRANQNRFSYEVVNDALHFLELPPLIRDFVLEGGVSYRAGVEIGRTIPIFKMHALVKYFGGKSEEQLSAAEAEEFNGGLLDWLGLQVAEIQNGKFNVTTLRGRYESKRQDLLSEMPAETIEGQPDPVLFEMANPLDNWRLIRRRQRDEHAGLFRRLASRPLEQAATLANLHLEILERDEATIVGLSESLYREYIEKIGRKMITASEELSSVDTPHIA